MQIETRSLLSCPEYGHCEDCKMPQDACQWFYDCTSCGTLPKPRPGDCCVFCSYGTTPCPPVQAGDCCCG
ncbi:hypothetical protein RSK20926_06922 [Roseobacter sp. SK209-2-6]|uniref:GDCCVxC domain-containing (seleno)protein n=1 Tax=Roseobacter sp. SK209-2-6 TaxID=388739 RepID=UPI0000F3D7E4|nr:GDCCVxC domain-containing (seleno)protein [Roseobacter sp. SK209-2-6]EBA17449.1 hypothetical protein RSK20926_06922 [Roseobacter sp. SK209-2-6]